MARLLAGWLAASAGENRIGIASHAIFSGSVFNFTVLRHRHGCHGIAIYLRSGGGCRGRGRVWGPGAKISLSLNFSRFGRIIEDSAVFRPLRQTVFWLAFCRNGLIVAILLPSADYIFLALALQLYSEPRVRQMGWENQFRNYQTMHQRLPRNLFVSIRRANRFGWADLCDVKRGAGDCQI